MADPRKEEKILFPFGKKPSKSNYNEDTYEDTYKGLETKSKKELNQKKEKY